MLKSDLIAILVQKRGITQKQAESTVETIFECMKDALCAGENIEIRGLGAFHVKHYEGYQGRNPKTGQVIPVKPKRGILFRTGKELRDRVNRSGPSGEEAGVLQSVPLAPASSPAAPEQPASAEAQVSPIAASPPAAQETALSPDASKASAPGTGSAQSA
jgi:integration host factor subunit beta